MYPDSDLFALHAGPVPVRKKMQHGLLSPPRLVVVEGVFGKSAGVDDAVLRADVGPAVGRGLAAIVEAGPHEAAGQPGAGVAETPPAFGRGAAGCGVGIVGADVAF